MTRSRDSRWIVGLALAVPWVLPPLHGGPSPSIVQWLFSLACISPLIYASSSTTWRQSLPFSLAVAWLTASLISSVIGVFQYLGLEQHFAPWMSQTRVGESLANLRQRNQFATLTTMGLVALIWCAVMTGQEPQRSVTRACKFAFAVILLSAGNAASSSRTGLVQLGLLVGLAFLWGWLGPPRTRRMVLLGILPAYLAALLFLPVLAGLDPASGGVLGRLHEEAPACASRWTLWTNVLHLIAQKPWLGWGWGELDYAHYVTLYPAGRFCDILDNAHNLPLHLAVELGVPLSVAICAIAGWSVWRIAPWREVDGSRQMAWGVLAVIMLHSMLEYPLWYGPFQVAFGLCVCLLWPATGVRGASSGQLVRAAPLRIAIIGGLLASVAYAAWDYHRISQIYLAPQARDAAYRDDTLEKIRESKLFKKQVRFAELTTTPLTRSNAEWTFQAAGDLLHFSPEPRVIEKLIESAVMLRRDDEAMFHLVRYRAAFPADYAKWRNRNGLGERGAN
jgi:O-antigen ligase